MTTCFGNHGWYRCDADKCLVEEKFNKMKALHAAIKAAKKVPAWGLYAAMRHALKNGATFAQFHIAERFEERRAIRRRLGNEFAGYLA